MLAFLPNNWLLHIQKFLTAVDTPALAVYFSSRSLQVDHSFFQNTKLPDTSLFNLQCFSVFTQFVWLWRFIISLDLYPDTDSLIALTQEHALWFIIYWYHQQHPGPLWDIRTLPKFSCFQEDASLQIRNINVVQHPAVTE